MSLKDIKELAPYAAGRKKIPENFALEAGCTVQEAFTGALQKVAGNINNFNKNKFDIYQIIIEQADEIVPAKVIDFLGMFAEVRVVGLGQKPMFRTRLQGKNRAKKFLTRVGLYGVYETFRLDRGEYEVPTKAIGTGVSTDFLRLITGEDSLEDLMEIVNEIMTDAVFMEVHKALRAAVDVANVPARNRAIFNTFIADEMFKIVTTVRAYSGAGGIGQNGGAVIFAPPEFVAAMGPDAIVPSMAGAAQGIYPVQDITSIHLTGYITTFRGVPVVQIPQSFTDESNEFTYIDPQLAYVLPTGGEKVIKVVLEGQLQIWDAQNKDNSYEIMFSKMIGTAIESYHNWGIYKNTGIAQTMYDPYTNI